MPKYQDIYPSEPLIQSVDIVRPTVAAELLTLEYFEALPGSMPIDRYQQHHIILKTARVGIGSISARKYYFWLQFIK